MFLQKKVQIFINPILKFKLYKGTNLTVKKLMDAELWLSSISKK